MDKLIVQKHSLQHDLYLANNQITEFKGLKTLISLKKLELGYNQITEIKGLNTLVNLQKLWLPNNRITEVKGLETLTNLQELWLNNNQITDIDYMCIPNSLIILYCADKYYDLALMRRFKSTCIKIRKEIIKIIFVEKCRAFLQKCRDLHPNSDYVTNILKPRFEELKN